MAAPAPCSTSKLHIVTRKLPSDHAAVQPGDIATTTTYGVKPEEFFAFQAAHEGHDVLSVLTILNVTFSDGPMWSRPRNGHASSEQFLRYDRDWQCAH